LIGLTPSSLDFGAVPVGVWSDIPGDTASVPVEEDITLGPQKLLLFQGVDGSFTLYGGEILHFRWISGSILLNGKRFWPVPTREEYIRWKGPYTRAELDLYREVPFIEQRIRLYGDTDAGWHRAYTEWDSLRNFTLSQVSHFCDTHPRSECIEHLVGVDLQTGQLVDWAKPNELGIQVKWKGLPYPIIIPIPARTPSPSAFSVPVDADRAGTALRTLKHLLEEGGPARVELSFGNIKASPLE